MPQTAALFRRGGFGDEHAVAMAVVVFHAYRRLVRHDAFLPERLEQEIKGVEAARFVELSKMFSSHARGMGSPEHTAPGRLKGKVFWRPFAGAGR